MDITLYGFGSCRHLNKAHLFLTAAGIRHRIHDHYRDGVDIAQVQRWFDTFGWRTVIYRYGTGWQCVPPLHRMVMDEQRIMRWIPEEPRLVRSPLVEFDGEPVLLGFHPDAWRLFFGLDSMQKSRQLPG
ncbi:ArsC/Spx/MgsR family protein [Isoalcanivorax beigongshangi]|uniref:ArsC/Spx/MgsR family protein n=1 Tax=Isoalcanivorax beigongshangi TaxID=3238810 RepID=A0ABV4AHH1_9GAMM